MLIEETKKYKVETEVDATELIEEAKRNQTDAYTISKAGYTRKDVKVKGEIIGEIFTVTITKKFE